MIRAIILIDFANPLRIGKDEDENHNHIYDLHLKVYHSLDFAEKPHTIRTVEDPSLFGREFADHNLVRPTAPLLERRGDEAIGPRRALA